MSTVELEAQRAVTLAYIAAAPVSIVLTPVVKVKTANGSTPTPGDPRQPQTFKVNEPGDSGARYPLTAGEVGKERVVEYILIGAYDAVVENNDIFTYRDEEYQVIQVLTPNDYEVRAMAVRRGW